MDLIAAARVFVEVAERGTMTRAAASLGIAQSVASRRVASLERHLAGTLLERNTRRAVLTPFGRDLLPSARRLVRLADELAVDADRARLRPLTIAVPSTCATRDLAVVDAAGSAAGVRLDFLRELPARRVELVDASVVRLAVVAVPAAEARWTAPLGAAGRRAPDRPLRLDGLRARRSPRSRPVRGSGPQPGRPTDGPDPGQHRTADRDSGATLRIGPEDDVPHVRDVLERAASATGLLPGQLAVDTSVTAALAGVLARGDLLLCTAGEARDLDLHWRPFEGTELVRGSTLVGRSPQDVQTVADTVGDELAAALGADPAPGATGTVRPGA